MTTTPLKCQTTWYNLFLIKKEGKIFYRITRQESPCYDSEIDAKCKALPYNKEHKIPLCLKIKDSNLKSLLTYQELNRELLDVKLNFSKERGWHLEAK